MTMNWLIRLWLCLAGITAIACWNGYRLDKLHERVKAIENGRGISDRLGNPEIGRGAMGNTTAGSFSYYTPQVVSQEELDEAISRLPTGDYVITTPNLRRTNAH